MDPHTLSRILLGLGVASVLASALIWMQCKRHPGDERARCERSALFVGLWAPSLFALAIYVQLLRPS